MPLASNNLAMARARAKRLANDIDKLSSVLNVLGEIILSFQGCITREARGLRCVSKTFRNVVSNFPWSDLSTRIPMNVTLWVKCFPRAQAANLEQRNDLIAEDFALFGDVRALNISGCTQACVSDGSFIKARASVNVEDVARLREAARAMGANLLANATHLANKFVTEARCWDAGPASLETRAAQNQRSAEADTASRIAAVSAKALEGYLKGRWFLLAHLNLQYVFISSCSPSVFRTNHSRSVILSFNIPLLSGSAIKSRTLGFR